LVRDVGRGRNELGSESAEQHATNTDGRALQEIASRDRPIHAEVLVGAAAHDRRILHELASPEDQHRELRS
jgi:hypothetical protein